MTDADVTDFQALVGRVSVVFGKRTIGPEFTQLSSSYFRALRRWPIRDLERGADAWIASATKFPRPTEWVAAIPRQRANVPVLTHVEAQDYRRAERLNYQDDPCHCAACEAAGVTHRYLRFVPEFTEDDQDRRILEPITNRIVTAGHWEHGDELRRWYAARDQFYASARALVGPVDQKTGEPRVPFEQHLERIFMKRPTQKKPAFEPLMEAPK